jgi:hypothetical protein
VIAIITKKNRDEKSFQIPEKPSVHDGFSGIITVALAHY